MKFYIVNILSYNSMFDLIEAHTTGKSYRTIKEAKAEIDNLAKDYYAMGYVETDDTSKCLKLVSPNDDVDFIEYEYEEIEVQF